MKFIFWRVSILFSSIFFPSINISPFEGFNKPKQDEAFISIKKRKLSGKNFYYLSKTNSLKEAAKNLYKTLRMIKKKNFKSIAVEKISNIGLGEAINDRLIRASKF